MCCDQLVCAACGGRVSEARCLTCVSSRASVHSSGSAVRPEVVALLALLVVLLGLLAA